MLVLLNDPINGIIHPIRFDESTIVIGILHAYHLLFFSCTTSDWIHHIVFVLLGTITHFSVNIGYITALYHFFVCGLPGAVDYVALALMKDNQIKKETRLKIAVEMNVWLRSPGIIGSWVFAYVWYTYSYSNVVLNSVCFATITFATVINSQYYCRQVLLYAGKHAY